MVRELTPRHGRRGLGIFWEVSALDGWCGVDEFEAEGRGGVAEGVGGGGVGVCGVGGGGEEDEAGAEG